MAKLALWGRRKRRSTTLSRRQERIIRYMWREGRGAAEIAEQFGCHRSTVYRWLARPPRPSREVAAQSSSLHPGLRLRFAGEVLADAEKQPQSHIVLAWVGDTPLFAFAQDILKMGRDGLRQLAREAGANL